MTAVNDSVRMSASELEVGGTKRVDCPACGRRKFYITRTPEGLLYYCQRASCNLAGFVGDMSGGYDKLHKNEVELRPLTKELLPPTKLDEEWFERKIGLVAVGVRVVEDGRYALPILDPMGRTRGYTLRMPWGGSPRLSTWDGSKAMNYWHTNGPLQSWHYFGTRPHPTLVLVEDHLSAYRVAHDGMTGVALLGTDLTNAKVRELAQEQPEEVIIALDQDATDKGFALARKWGLAFRRTRVVPLSRDLKDEPLSEDVAELLGVGLL